LPGKFIVLWCGLGKHTTIYYIDKATLLF